ncbi:hypothetical protein GCM10018987_16900 [Streptomyces cremeus]
MAEDKDEDAAGAATAGAVVSPLRSRAPAPRAIPVFFGVFMGVPLSVRIRGLRMRTKLQVASPVHVTQPVDFPLRLLR